ncbi:MAG: STAS domain-containing protein [Anaerolineae bacterium]
MITPYLKTNIRYQTNVVIIDLVGEINTETELILNGAYTTASSRQTPTIVLNLSEVKYITSGGIAVLLDILGRARQADRQLIVYGLSKHYYEIFRIMHLTDFMKVFPDEAAALKQITGQEYR